MEGPARRARKPQRVAIGAAVALVLGALSVIGYSSAHDLPPPGYYCPPGYEYCPPPPPPNVPFDHMECYDVMSLGNFPIVGVELTDQFERKSHVKRKPKLLCNPAEKRHGGNVFPSMRPDAHLVCYEINRLSFPQRLVEVTNQFGTEQILVRWAEDLCAPSSKSGQGPPGAIPPNLDHFKCYKARGESVPRSLTLIDQFRQAQVTSLAADLLCNPTSKLPQGGPFTPVAFPDRHLVCYTVSPPAQVNRDVTVRNQFFRQQFGLERLRATRVRYVCVPSQKRELE